MGLLNYMVVMLGDGAVDLVTVDSKDAIFGSGYHAMGCAN